MLSCADAGLLLDDYVDGALDDGGGRDVERHLAACPACREQERGLRALLAQAAAMPVELQPEHDLWPAIAARLEPRRVVPFAPLRRRVGTGSLLAMAAAAAALLAVFLPHGDGLRGPAATPASAPLPVSSDAALQQASLGHTSSLGAAAAEYERATQQLLQALQSEGREMPAETLQNLHENLATIDQALGDIRAALAKDPQNAQLARLLNNTHRRRLTVLQQVVRLTRT